MTPTTTNNNTKTKEPSLLYGISTQTDWSQNIYSPGLRSILLLVLVVANESWFSYTHFVQTLPLFQSESKITNEEWRSSHHACMQAICQISRQISFDCKVDEAGDAAHMTILDGNGQEPLPFASEISIPQECFQAVELAAGRAGFELLDSQAKASFQVETINLLHYYEKPELLDEQSGKKKAIFQLLPGQCAVWDILQQGWYEFFGDGNGDPPPPIPLIDFSAVEPNQVVHVDTSDFICFEREKFHDDGSFMFWSKLYAMALEYRYQASWLILVAFSASLEFMHAVSAMIRLLPLTLCIVGLSSDDGQGDRFIIVFRQAWKVWRSLFLLCIVALTVSDSEHIYLVCALAAISMLYNNSKAAMEWGFLHLLAYLPTDLLESFPLYEMIYDAIDDMLDIFVPTHHVVWKLAVFYMIYSSFPQLSKRK